MVHLEMVHLIALTGVQRGVVMVLGGVRGGAMAAVAGSGNGPPWMTLHLVHRGTPGGPLWEHHLMVREGELPGGWGGMASVVGLVALEWIH